MSEFQKVAIIGLGLIGSSVARALHEHGLAVHITGCDVSAETLAYCMGQGFIQSMTSSPEEAVKDADLVVICVPPSAFSHICDAIIPALKDGAIVTDTLSVKSMVADAVPNFPFGVSVIPAHPIAGSEKTGPEAGNSKLFAKRKVILTPLNPQQTPPLMKVRSMWETFGSDVQMMPAEAHDVIYAIVSHLPQLIGFATSNVVSSKDTEILKRFTRLQRSDPALWASIFWHNRVPLLRTLEDYLSIVSHVMRELAEGEDKSEESSDNASTDTLVARICASCLVVTITMFEKQTGLTLAQFAGSGFADIACPAIDDPDTDIEAISHHYKQVRIQLEQFHAALESFRQALSEKDDTLLLARCSGRIN